MTTVYKYIYESHARETYYVEPSCAKKRQSNGGSNGGSVDKVGKLWAQRLTRKDPDILCRETLGSKDTDVQSQQDSTTRPLFLEMVSARTCEAC